MQFLIETQRADRGRQVAVVETLTDVRAIAAELAGQDAQMLGELERVAPRFEGELAGEWGELRFGPGVLRGAAARRRGASRRGRPGASPPDLRRSASSPAGRALAGSWMERLDQLRPPFTMSSMKEKPMSKRTESPRGKAPGRDRDRKEAERRRQTRRRIRKIVERHRETFDDLSDG
jgi:hypothetical protein